jgi:hypothetical protein
MHARFRSTRRLIAAVTVLTAAALSSSAVAAPLPGTLDPVAPGVPDNGRVWELVTPSDGIAALLSRALAISPSGDRVAYNVWGGLPGATESPMLGVGLASRGVGGWTSVPVSKPEPLSTLVFRDETFAFTPDLTSSIWVNELSSSPDDSLGLFRGQPSSGYSLLADMGSGGGFIAASKDLNRVLFATSQALLSADAGRTSGSSIYEVTGSVLSLVNVDSSGSLLSECGATASPQALSSDGQRVFFASRDASQSCTDPVHVYMRAGGVTTEISASQCTRVDCSAPADVAFLGESEDGSSAFLSTAQQLTNEDTNAMGDLYRYDVSSGDLVLLTPRASASLADVTTDPVHLSSDGSRVYFWAVGALLDDVGAEPEAKNLYELDATGLHFVARRVKSVVQLADNGRYAVFSTVDPLVQGDTDENIDVYRFDATDGSYEWVSVSPTGGDPSLQAELGPDSLGNTAASHPYRVVSNDGEQIFFFTDEQLIPEDQNQRTDVYEWAGGELGLLSAGTPGIKAWYIGSTPDGSTGLFMTAATLVPRDSDGGDLDFYAARIGGGFSEPVTPTGCGGTACRGSIAPRVVRTVPDSANPPPRRGGGIRLAAVGPAAARQIVDSGWLTVLAEVPAPGRFAATARAVVDGRRHAIAAGSVRAREAGPVRLRARLSKAARGSLERGSSLHVRLSARLDATSARPLSFTLPGVR